MLHLAVLLALASVSTAVDLREARSEWRAFKSRYGKVYTESQEAARFDIFKENMDLIDRLNAEHPLAHFSINSFADLSKSEFAALHMNGHKIRPLNSKPSISPRPIPGGSLKADSPPERVSAENEERSTMKRVTLPTNYTSPYATAAQNQGSCGSCWAFSAIGVAEAAWKKSTGNTVRFSPQQILDCMPSNGGCDGDNEYSALQYLVGQSNAGVGLQTEANYPYKTAKQSTCGVNNSKAVGYLEMAYSFTLDETVGGNTDTMLYYNSPLAVALDADTLSYYSSGILTATSGCTGTVNHAVLLTGWGTANGVKYWVIKNSWGSSWGESGSFRIVRGSNACNLCESVGAVAKGATLIPLATCGTRTCGTVNSGTTSANLLSCGWCSDGTTCKRDGTCQSMIDSAQWIEMFSSKHFGVTVSGTSTTITASNSNSYQYFLRWNSSSSWTNKNWTAFQTFFNFGATGTMGLGVTDNTGSSNGVFWQVKVTSYTSGASTATATIAVCILASQKKNCQTVSSTYAFPMLKSTNLTAYYVRNSGYVATWLEINTVSLTGKQYIRIPSLSLQSIGEAYLLYSGLNKSFTQPKVYTRVRFLATAATYCITHSQWRTQVATFLGIPESTVIQAITSSTDSGGCTSAYGSAYATVHDLIIKDATNTSITSNFGYGNVVSHMTATALFNRLTDYALSGILALYGTGTWNSIKIIEHSVNTSAAITFTAATNISLITKRSAPIDFEPAIWTDIEAKVASMALGTAPVSLVSKWVMMANVALAFVAVLGRRQQ